MGDAAVWEFIANMLVLLAWLPSTLFILDFGFGSTWRDSMAGRTLMLKALSTWCLLSYILWVRWFSPDDLLRNSVATGVLLLIVFTLWRLYVVLRLVRAGRIDRNNFDWTPMRDWIARRRARRLAKTER